LRKTLKSPEEYRILLRSRWGSVEPTGSPSLIGFFPGKRNSGWNWPKPAWPGFASSSPHALPESDGHDVLLEKPEQPIPGFAPGRGKLFKHIRWSFVEEMSVSHFFDLEALIAYYFKLQLALRQEKFQKAAGQEAFDKVYEKVRESLNNHYV
jgi:hypothetical protein